MKGSRRYIVLGVLLALVLLGKINTWSDDYSQVEAFRGAQLEEQVFYPLKARNINATGLATLTVGDRTYHSRSGDIQVNDNLRLMGSLDLVQELFGASAHLYEDGKILLERNGDHFRFQTDQVEAARNEDLILLEDAPFIREDVCYLPLKDLCDQFSCSYAWDEAACAATMESGNADAFLPDRYDLRARDRAPEILDQGSTSTCWAYAALGALSSELLPLEKTAYSVEAMTEHNAFGLPVSRGGDYTMAAAYFLSWDGPRDDRGNVKKHVQEIQFFDEDDREAIKWAVYQHGGVSTSIYADVNGSNLEKSSYYSKEDNAYCYRGKEEPNHDVVIIGWDDDYGAEHFPGRVPGDGALICQNSWGESFGEEGVFYISYYDSNIGTQSAAYTKVENTDNYDTIYQSDLCGWVGSLGYNRERILAANVFEAQETQQIAAAGFYALGKNTTYQVYMVSNFQDVGSLAGRTPMASGAVENKGYYTIPFDYPVTVEKGSRFAVVIMLETPGSTLPMAVEYATDERTEHVDISDGEGYISSNGLDWERVEDKAEGNLCLKAYGRALPEQ